MHPISFPVICLHATVFFYFNELNQNKFKSRKYFIIFFFIWLFLICYFYSFAIWLNYLTCIGLRSLVLLCRRFFGFTCRSSSAKLTDEAKPSEPIVSSNENVASFSESKLISNPESEPSRPYKHFGSMVTKRLVIHKHGAFDHRTLAGTRSRVGGPAVLLLGKCNTLIIVVAIGVGVYLQKPFSGRQCFYL